MSEQTVSSKTSHIIDTIRYV